LAQAIGLLNEEIEEDTRNTLKAMKIKRAERKVPPQKGTADEIRANFEMIPIRYQMEVIPVQQMMLANSLLKPVKEPIDTKKIGKQLVDSLEPIKNVYAKQQLETSETWKAIHIYIEKTLPDPGPEFDIDLMFKLEHEREQQGQKNMEKLADIITEYRRPRNVVLETIKKNTERMREEIWKEITPVRNDSKHKREPLVYHARSQRKRKVPTYKVLSISR
jgi:hypothetical protein